MLGLKGLRFIKWFLVTVLLLVGCGLIFNHQIASWVLSQQHSKIETKNVNKKVSYNFRNVKAISTSDVIAAQLKAKHFIGVVAMPQINLSVPISEGVSNQTLKQGAGTLRKDQQMGVGNYALAGHNMHKSSTILFGPLYTSAKVGQKIYLSDLKHVYEYKAILVRQIPATDVGVVSDTPEKIVTLITCNNDGSARIEVRGKFVKKYAYKTASHKLKNTLTQNVKAK